MTSRTRWGLAGILLFGFGLRCIALQSRGIAYDDAFSILLSEKSLAAIVQGTAADTMPPLYYFLLHFWMQIGGIGLGWLRLLSVILNMASLVVLFVLVRALVDDSAGLCAVFLGAISPLQIYHAQDLRMYALLALAQLTYCWFFIRIWRHTGPRPPWGDWLGLAVSGAVAMYTHNLAVFVLAIPNVYLLVRRQWRPLRDLLLAQLVIGLLALPWLVQVPGQIDKIQRAFWTPRPGLVEVIQSIILFTTNLPLTDFWLSAGLAISLAVFIFIVWQGIRLIRERKLPGFLTMLVFLPPILLFAASYIMRPVFVTRGFLAAALGYLGLAGTIVTRRWPVVPAGLILAGFVAGAAIGLPINYFYDGFPRSPFQPAMETLREQIQPGDQIIHDNKLSFFPSRYFAPDLPMNFLADAPGSENDTLAPASQQAFELYPQADMEHAVGIAQRVFFVVFGTTLQEYQQTNLLDHPQLAWLKTRFKENVVTHYGDLLVYEFNR